MLAGSQLDIKGKNREQTIIALGRVLGTSQLERRASALDRHNRRTRPAAQCHAYPVLGDTATCQSASRLGAQHVGTLQTRLPGGREQERLTHSLDTR